MRGYYETLRPFLDKGEEQRIENYEHFETILCRMKAYKYVHKVVVIEDRHSASETDRVVGTGTIMVKPDWKTGTLVAHIMDMGVKKEHQENRLAQRLLNLLMDMAKDEDCFKIVLETYTEAVNFYVKRGFKKDKGYMVYNVISFDSTLLKMEKLRQVSDEPKETGYNTPKGRSSNNLGAKSPILKSRDEEFSFKVSTPNTDSTNPDSHREL